MHSSNRFTALSEKSNWTRGGPKKTYALANGGAGIEHARSSIEYETKRRLHAVSNQMKTILQTSGGDLTIISTKLIDYYYTLSKSEEKAKFIGVLVENSLHELFCPDTFFGNIISNEMSITSSLNGLKERDGYNLYSWVVWISWNLVRTEYDIISSIASLIANRVNPFRINQKHESIFDTAAMCVKRNKFSMETYNMIYKMLLYNPIDTDLYLSSLKHSFPDILNPEMKFTKGYLQWCLTVNDELCDAVIAEAFETDKFRLGESKVSFQTTDFQYVTAFNALMLLIRSAPHKNFEQFFYDHPIDVNGLTYKIASYYMTNIMKLHHTAYQLLDEVMDGWAFKNIENLGAFVWDLSHYIDISPDDFAKFSNKIKVGYGVRGLKKAGVNIDLLRKLLAGSLSHVERSFVTRAIESMESAAISVVISKPVVLVEHAPKLINSFKTGLEKLTPDEVIMYSSVSGGYHTPRCIHDSICDIAEMIKTHNPEVIERSFVHASCALYKTHHLANLRGHIKYLTENNILNKDAIKKVIDEESKDILDANDYSKSSKEALNIIVTSL